MACCPSQSLLYYPDTHRYRIGPNYLQLPVNRPQSEVHSYSKDGAMRYRHNGDQPVYAPNSYGGPKAGGEQFADAGWSVSGELLRSAYVSHEADTDFVQVGEFYRKALSQEDRDHLVGNIVGHLSEGVEGFIQERAVGLWRQVDEGFGMRIAAGLGLSSPKPEGASAD